MKIHIRIWSSMFHRIYNRWFVPCVLIIISLDPCGFMWPVKPYYAGLPCTVYLKKYAHGFCFAVFVVVIHWLIFPYPSGLLHWHCGNLTIAPVPAKQPWWIWINTSCEFIMNDCITTTKQSTTKPCAYFLGYTVLYWPRCRWSNPERPNQPEQKQHEK